MPTGRTFTILLDADDLSCIRSVQPEALAGEVLSFDLDLHLQMQDLGIAHRTPWEFLHSESRSEMESLERLLWNTWSRHALIPFNGMNLMTMTEYRHRAWMARLTWARHVLDQAFQKLRPAELIVFEEPSGHGLNPPIGYNKMPVLFMLARGMAEHRGIPVRVIRQAEQAGRPRYVDKVAESGRRRLEPVEVERFLNNRDYILFTGSGADLTRQIPLIRQVDAEGRYLVLQLYKSADSSTLDVLRAEGHLLWHDSQVLQEVPLPDVAVAGARARDSLRAACGDSPGPIRDLFLNRRLDPHYDFLFGEYAAKMGQYVLGWSAFLNRYRPAAIVVNHVAPINDVAVHAGIPGLIMPHGLAMTANVRLTSTIKGFHVGAISSVHRRNLIASGVPAQQVHVTGDTRVDEILGDKRPPPVPRDRAAAKQALLARLGGKRTCRLVLLATGNMGMPAQRGSLPATDWANAARCLEEIFSLAGQHPDWRWAVKPHPRFDHPLLYERVNRTLPGEHQIIVTRNATLHELVPGADAVVVFNVITSAGIEASFHGTPVLILHQSMPWYQPDEFGMDGWRHVASAPELERELAGIFSSPQAYEDLVAQTRQGLERYLDGQPKPAVSRCCRLLHNIARPRHPSCRAG